MSFQRQHFNNRFLVIVRAGKFRYYEKWLHDSHRKFDILLSSYSHEVGCVSGNGVFFELRPGKKVESISKVLREHDSFLESYHYVAIFDEDLEISTVDLNRVFDIASDEDFKICQPSLSTDSFFTYAALLQNRAFKFRYINFIEMMCPIFRSDTLLTISKIYSLGYESGIDLLWCNVDSPQPGDFAVIDEVAIRHTQPVGEKKAENGFVAGRIYEDDIHAVIDRFQLPSYSCLPYLFKDSNYSTIGRFIYFLTSINLIFTVFKRKPYWLRLRLILVHWKQIACSKPLNVSREV